MTIKMNLKEGQTEELLKTELMHSPETMSGVLKESYKGSLWGNHFKIELVVEMLQDSISQVKEGNLDKVEAMLLTQSDSLSTLFTSFAVLASKQTSFQGMQTLINLALKAQNQSRMTLDSLVQMKQPTAFIKQTNISHGHQQVNNSLENNPFPQNELLEKELDVSPKMDSRATIKAK